MGRGRSAKDIPTERAKRISRRWRVILLRRKGSGRSWARS